MFYTFFFQLSLFLKYILEYIFTILECFFFFIKRHLYLFYKRRDILQLPSISCNQYDDIFIFLKQENRTKNIYTIYNYIIIFITLRNSIITINKIKLLGMLF